jgi:hypothetical protein
MISKFRRFLNVVFSLLGNSPASEFYMPTFRNTLMFHLRRQVPSCGPPRHEPYILHTTARGLHVGRYPRQPAPVLGPAPSLSPSFRLAQAIYEPNLFPYKYPSILNPSHSWVMVWYDIFINCSWVATRWQQYSTHLHTNSTQNNTKQTIHRTTHLGRVRAVSHLYGCYPGICLTAEEKARKNLSQGSLRDT